MMSGKILEANIVSSLYGRKGLMNAILIILDTLRQDHVGCYGNNWIKTPHLDALARESVRFTNMYPESLPTLPCRRSIYTGRRVFPFVNHSPQKGDFVGLSPGWGPIEEDRETLAETLQMYRYRTCLISDVYHQFKPSKNFHRGFDQWTWIRGQESDSYLSGPLPSKDLILHHTPENILYAWQLEMALEKYLTNIQYRKREEDYFAPQVFGAAMDWLDANRDAKNFFLTIESFDPHEPWDPPLHYRRLYDDEEVPGLREVIFSLYGSVNQLTARELKRMRANYAGEVTMVDLWLGKFIAKVRELRLLEKTLIVVVSDHGHCLGEHGIVSKQGYPMSREVADLVMMIRYPDGTAGGRVCNALCYQHDIPATILKALDLSPPDEMEGKDLRPAIVEGKQLYDHATTGWGPFVMVRDHDYWYNAYLWGERPMLFDLRADPHLANNLADRKKDVVKRMSERALEDAGGMIPEHLRVAADMNIPGCTPLEAQLE
ncbi:MAG: sulfatase [Candidatus Abyssobacteria bacterium SURF_5]|uniref:Sulfatase n=1 Tax=Abyssobacteria bacterium (strain SURF_5) TaxID=2093360 RepID=A0A3A4NSZ6_ABYX5|nr:MAG: sulfatase [Candidatus Abyssubacteria bacterium SURF_5]